MVRFPHEYRTIDGSGNNPSDPTRGAAGTPLARLTTVAYGDGSESPARQDQASPRIISNLCVAQDESRLSSAGASDFVWQWGQFLDHDIDLSPTADPVEPLDIAVPTDDTWFAPAPTILFDRSAYAQVGGIRQQINAITSFIDASNVYGSDEARAMALRTLDGTGRLRTSAGNLLPFNDDALPNAPTAADSTFFLAGDVRANEQVGLTAMHTLFVREHNHWADRIAAATPGTDDETIYQMARAIVAAELQAITYNEFLPVVLGSNALAPYHGYDPGVSPEIANVFATAAYRFGHSMLSPELRRLDARGRVIAAGDLGLRDAFFQPQVIVDDGIEPLLRGLAKQQAQEVDNQIVDGVRNFLFGEPGAGGFDLASLNIQRGRDHGLPGYNQVRRDFGLPAVTSIADVSPDPNVQACLAAAYSSIDDVDPWVGGLAEPHVAGGLVGETWHAILSDQFERLRDGDRFWYRGYLPRAVVRMVERQSLAKIIRRNTRIGREVSGNVFLVAREGR